MSIITDAKKYLHEKPSAFMTKDRRLKRSAVLIEKLVKEIEQKDKVVEAAKTYMSPHEAGENLELEHKLVVALIQHRDTLSQLEEDTK